MKSKLEKGQMGQNHLDFEDVQNPNDLVWILDNWVLKPEPKAFGFRTVLACSIRPTRLKLEHAEIQTTICSYFGAFPILDFKISAFQCTYAVFTQLGYQTIFVQNVSGIQTLLFLFQTKQKFKFQTFTVVGT